MNNLPCAALASDLATAATGSRPVRYVDAWLRLAGYRDDRIFRLYVGLFLVDFMSEHGQTFNANRRPSSVAERANLLRPFAECLQQLEN